MKSDKTTILVVDDDITILETVAEFLEDNGYEVFAAANGAYGLQVMQTCVPDLIVSDVMMPEVDGYHFLEVVHSNLQWIDIPFIFLTARGQPSDILHGHASGADAYLTKPFELDDLLVMIESRLRRALEIRSKSEADVNRMKQQIITSFSHELRTPLTYMFGYVDLLKSGWEDYNAAEIADMFNTIERGTKRLVHLVEDLMLIASIESGALDLQIRHHQARVTLAPIVAQVIRDFSVQAERRGVAISMEMSDTLEVQCIAAYLQDALARLLDNAIKFSQLRGGTVTIQAQAQNDQVAIQVKDNGIGIDPSQQKLLFKKMQQIDREIMEQQGVGMSLAIVRGLVQLHGGTVQVDSKLGEGSSFTIQLPLPT